MPMHIFILAFIVCNAQLIMDVARSPLSASLCIEKNVPSVEKEFGILSYVFQKKRLLCDMIKLGRSLLAAIFKNGILGAKAFP